MMLLNAQPMPSNPAFEQERIERSFREPRAAHHPITDKNSFEPLHVLCFPWTCYVVADGLPTLIHRELVWQPEEDQRTPCRRVSEVIGGAERSLSMRL